MSESTPSNPANSAMPRFESPLHHVDLVRLAEPTGAATVTVAELPGLSHLILRGNASDSAFTAGVETVLGIPLPLQPCSSSHSDSVKIRWQSPDEWLIIAADSARSIEEQLRSQLEGHFSISDVSGGQTLVALSGSNAENVLRKSTPYDVSLRNLPVGKVVGTVLAKTQLQLCRTGEESFELILRRSFADYLWMWLVDAGQEYGVTYQRC